MGLSYNGEGTHRYETRGGPLIREPHTYGGWAGVSSDSRKSFVLTLEGNYFVDTAKNLGNHYTGTVKWNQSSSINHSISLNFDNRVDDTQWLANVSSADYPNARGIGGVSYVFGDIHQETFDITLRSNVLFSRNQSLEIYAQPFITTGDYTRVRERIHPDSYDFLPFVESLEADLGAELPVGAAWVNAAATAVRAAESTASLTPRLGRARPLAARSLGHPDPGAMSFAIVMTAVSEHFA